MGTYTSPDQTGGSWAAEMLLELDKLLCCDPKVSLHSFSHKPRWHSHDRRRLHLQGMDALAWITPSRCKPPLPSSSFDVAVITCGTSLFQTTHVLGESGVSPYALHLCTPVDLQVEAFEGSRLHHIAASTLGSVQSLNLVHNIYEGCFT